MEILIKNLRFEKPQFEYQVRVDRASILGNPYFMHNESERDEVCDRYKTYFYQQFNGNETFREAVRKLYRIAKHYGRLELFCWCAPKRCHAETIRNCLMKYFKEEN